MSINIAGQSGYSRCEGLNTVIVNTLVLYLNYEKSQSNAAVFYILFGSLSKGFLFGNQTEIKGSQNMTYECNLLGTK